MSTYINMDIQKKYCSSHAIHNQPILENGWHLFPIHISTFGDFDLAGIHIFLSEFQKHLGTERTFFLIPEDISSRLRCGSTRRYNEQYARYKDIKSDRREIQQLIDLIHHEA